jgi:hypothetical protein
MVQGRFKVAVFPYPNGGVVLLEETPWYFLKHGRTEICLTSCGEERLCGSWDSDHGCQQTVGSKPAQKVDIYMWQGVCITSRILAYVTDFITIIKRYWSMY